MITSLENKRVKDWCRLHMRKYRQSECLLYEEETIRAAKDTGHLHTLIYTGEIPFEWEDSVEVSKEVLDKISEGRDARYIGVAELLEEKKDYQKRVLILDHLQDPLNIGRIFETALLFGFDSVILSEGCADIYHEKALEASRGALYYLNVSCGDLLKEIPEMKKAGFRVYATGLRDETKELYEVEPYEKMAFILGNEGSGVRSEVMDIADEIVRIDMDNIDSLNVSMAGAIVAYRFRLSNGR